MSVANVAPLPDIAGFLPGAQFSDAYSTVSDNASLSAREAAETMFARQPRWITKLMALRDALVAPFGLKTGNDAASAGDRVAIFPVISQTPTRLVAGLDDRHQDFRIVIDVQPMGAKRRVTLTTIVKTHNVFGRTYLATIMPFHRIIVRTMLGQLR